MDILSRINPDGARHSVEEGPIVLPRAEAPLVSILIVTTSQAQRLENCLRSLVRHRCDGLPCEVVIVMNAAAEPVKELVRDKVRGALVVDSPVNLGLAGGNNRARSLAGGRYLMMLHDDTEVVPGWLQTLVETAEAHPEAGAVASMTLNFDGSLQACRWIIWKDLSVAWDWGEGPKPAPEHYREVQPTDFSGSNSLLVRAGTWDAMGGLDERIYPAYFVDVDIGMSIRNYGQTVLLQPQSRVFHHRGSSSRRLYRKFMMVRNHIYMKAKWGDRVADYEVYVPGDPAALERARARTEREAAVLRENWAKSPPPPRAVPPPAPFDPRQQELKHLEMAEAMPGEYEKFVQERCLELEDERKQWVGELNRVRSEKNRLESRLEQEKQRVKDLKEARDELKAALRKMERSFFGRCYRLLRPLGRTPGKRR